MAIGYDPRFRILNVCVDLASGSDINYSYHIPTDSWWPCSYSPTWHLFPTFPAIQTADKSSGLLVSSSGDVYQYDRTNISGGSHELFDSKVLLGPLRLGGNSNEKGMLVSLTAFLANGSGALDWRLYGGDTAEEAYDKYVAATPDYEGHAFSREYGNYVQYPNRSFAFCYIEIYDQNNARWLIEEMVAEIESAGPRRVTLGGVLADLSALTDEDCSPAMRAIIERMVEEWTGSGCPAAKKPGQEKVYAVYYRVSDGAFVGGNPQNPTVPHVLLTAAGGTITVEEEGTPLTPRGIINFIGASVTAADDGVDTTNVTITGGSSDSFKTISCTGSTSLVADSATDLLNLVAGSLMAITLSEPAGVETATFASTLTIFRALVNDATHVVGTDATFLFDNGTSMLGTAPSSGTCSNLHGRAFIDNEEILVFGNGAPTYYAIKISPTIAVGDTGGGVVAVTDSTFSIGDLTAISGTAPTGTVTVDNNFDNAGLHGGMIGQYTHDQCIPVILKTNGQWAPIRTYDTAMFKVTTAITARSFSTPTYTMGNGLGTLLKKTGTTTYIEASSPFTGVTILNSTTSTVAVDRIIQCKRIDGEWFVDVDDC